MGFEARGIDSSPVAVAIAKAKLCKVDLEATLALARSYIVSHHARKVPDTEFFRLAFAPGVLQRVCAIREGLLRAKRDTDASVLLRAAMLGCLHGPTSKQPDSQSYFSNQMPRTFAAKPDYSVRFWGERGLKPRESDVLAVLRRKLSRMVVEAPPSGVTHANVRLGDSRLANSVPVEDLDFSVIVTSPPYYGMRTYVEDQWLRNWFLGGPDHVEYGLTKQLQHTGREMFAESLGAVWRNMARSRASELHMYIRFGTIPSAAIDPKELIRASLEVSRVSWRVISIREAATASSGRRQAEHMAARSVAAPEYDFHVSRK